MNEVIEKAAAVRTRGLGALLSREKEILEKKTYGGPENIGTIADLPIHELHEQPAVIAADPAVIAQVDFGQKKTVKSKKEFKMKTLKPISFGQEQAFEAFLAGKNLLFHGLAGTGKTFVAMYLALNEMNRFKLEYDKVIVIRSIVPSRDAGYLPGNIIEKAKAYEQPYNDAVNSLYARGDAYEMLKHCGKIEFLTTSYLRGVTWDKCIVVVDEIQNMTYGELATIITRAGQSCRFIFCGDFRQTDLEKKADREGLYKFMQIIERMKDEFLLVEFTVHDVVRSKLVKSFLTEEADYGAESAKGFNRSGRS